MFSGREVKVHTWTPWRVDQGGEQTTTDSERGAALVEYSLLLIFVAFTAFAMLTLFGGAVLELYTATDAQVSALVERPTN